MVAGVDRTDRRGNYYTFSKTNFEKWEKEKKFLEEVMVNMNPQSQKFDETHAYVQRLGRIIEENRAAYAAALRHQTNRR